MHPSSSYQTFLFLLLLFVHINNGISQPDEPILLERTLQDYDTQRYLYEHLTQTGSGTIFGLPVDISIRQTTIEQRIEQVVETVKVEPKSIGLIFHVLSTRELETIKTNIHAQLNSINEAFNLKNIIEDHPNDPQSRFLRLAASSQLEFYLPEIPETSEFGNGIVMVKDAGDKWRGYDAMKDPRNDGSKPIRSDEFINIWICNLENGVGSYSTSPYQETAQQGIVIDHRIFEVDPRGSSLAQRSNVLVHLIGNYLGLKDLWNDYEHCSDDNVKDTPRHNYRNFGCPPATHLSLCPGNPVEMTSNFMDSTDCPYMFTRGQVARMHAFLEVVRPKLIKR